MGSGKRLLKDLPAPFAYPREVAWKAVPDCRRSKCCKRKHRLHNLSPFLILLPPAKLLSALLSPVSRLLKSHCLHSCLPSPVSCKAIV